MKRLTKNEIAVVRDNIGINFRSRNSSRKPKSKMPTIRFDKKPTGNYSVVIYDPRVTPTGERLPMSDRTMHLGTIEKPSKKIKAKVLKEYLKMRPMD